MGLLGGRWGTAAAVIALAAAVVMGKQLGEQLGWDNSAMMRWLKEMSDRLGHWAIPAYVGLHTITLALCLPYAVFFEAGASMLFGFLPALLCVFTAKILGASLSFWIGRLVFRSYGSAAEWIQKNKYFNMLSRGVERDGWKFVLLARFSPNTSIGSLASAAVGSASGSQKSQASSQEPVSRKSKALKGK
ncbi:hypothetical protein AAHA92_07614 [Salvia divinorum]|uniref:VTT domain-containing protein n=1 Tax=Salvia divinorum TaxID=28513 RepID=A0ABD1I9K2_SALDI